MIDIRSTTIAILFNEKSFLQILQVLLQVKQSARIHMVYNSITQCNCASVNITSKPFKVNITSKPIKSIIIYALRDICSKYTCTYLD